MLAHVVSVRVILLSGVENRIKDNRFTDADTSRVLAKGIHALRAEVLHDRAQGGDIVMSRIGHQLGNSFLPFGM